MQQWARRTFIMRARKAPSGPNFSIDDLDAVRSRGLGVVAQTIANVLMVSRNQRSDTAIYVVHEGGGAPNPPRTLLFRGDSIRLDGVSEREVAAHIRAALALGAKLSGDKTAACKRSGIEVSCEPFESLVRRATSDAGGFWFLDKKGADWRDACAERDARYPSVFVLTDHLKQPKNSGRLMRRLGGRPISLGPRMLFACQAVCVVHNELDRWESGLDGPERGEEEESEGEEDY